MSVFSCKLTRHLCSSCLAFLLYLVAQLGQLGWPSCYTGLIFREASQDILSWWRHRNERKWKQARSWRHKLRTDTVFFVVFFVLLLFLFFCFATFSWLKQITKPVQIQRVGQETQLLDGRFNNVTLRQAWVQGAMEDWGHFANILPQIPSTNTMQYFQYLLFLCISQNH